MFGRGYDKVQAFGNKLDNFVPLDPGPRAVADLVSGCLGLGRGNQRGLRRHVAIDVGSRRDRPVTIREHRLSMTAYIHPTAIVEPNVELGQGTSVWDHAHIRRDTRLGEECIVGGKSYIAYDVSIGNRVKINSLPISATPSRSRTA